MGSTKKTRGSENESFEVVFTAADNFPPLNDLSRHGRILWKDGGGCLLELRKE